MLCQHRGRQICVPFVRSFLIIAIARRATQRWYWFSSGMPPGFLIQPPTCQWPTQPTVVAVATHLPVPASLKTLVLTPRPLLTPTPRTRKMCIPRGSINLATRSYEFWSRIERSSWVEKGAVLFAFLFCEDDLDVMPLCRVTIPCVGVVQLTLSCCCFPRTLQEIFSELEPLGLGFRHFVFSFWSWIVKMLNYRCSLPWEFLW
jgi:hypothetical protein